MDKEVLFTTVCNEVSVCSESTAKICKRVGIGKDAFYAMLKDDEKADRYARAKYLQLHVIADEILEIADEDKDDYKETEKGLKIDHDNIQRSKLRVEARKWILAKLAPEKYGDRLRLDTGKNELPTLPEYFESKVGKSK